MQPEEQREILRTVHSLRPRYPSHELSPLPFESVGYDTYIVVAYVSQLASYSLDTALSKKAISNV